MYRPQPISSRHDSFLQVRGMHCSSWWLLAASMSAVSSGCSTCNYVHALHKCTCYPLIAAALRRDWRSAHSEQDKGSCGPAQGQVSPTEQSVGSRGSFPRAAFHTLSCACLVYHSCCATAEMVWLNPASTHIACTCFCVLQAHVPAVAVCRTSIWCGHRHAVHRCNEA